VFSFDQGGNCIAIEPDCGLATAYDERPSQELRMLDHQLDQFFIGELL
jgi:hypothetical protein